MSWEQRGGSRYYYAATRVGGRVVKTYHGSGVVAKAAALFDAGDREEREKGKAEINSVRRKFSREIRNVERFADALRYAADISIESEGYHRHDRGKWRRRREREKKAMSEVEAVGGLDKYIPDTAEERRKVVLSLLDAKRPDEQERAVAITRAHPGEVTLRYMQEMRSAIRSIFDANPAREEILLNEAARLRKEFYGNRKEQDIPFAEYLLIERVIICRFATMKAEQRLGLPPHQLTAHSDKAIDRANRRYLAAIKALVEVQRLALPSVSVALPGSVQVNIGEKQVNLNHGGVTGEGDATPWNVTPGTDGEG